MPEGQAYTNFASAALPMTQAAGNTLISCFYALLPCALIIGLSVWAINKFFKISK